MKAVASVVPPSATALQKQLDCGYSSRILPPTENSEEPIKLLPLLALALFASSAVFVDSGDYPAKAKSDAAFAKKAAMSNLTEVELGRVAEKNAESSDVKGFAKMVVSEHSKADAELVKIAESENIELPTEVDAKNQAMVDKLAGKSGAEFDKEYIGHMVGHHKMSVKMYRAWYPKMPAVRNSRSLQKKRCQPWKNTCRKPESSSRN